MPERIKDVPTYARVLGKLVDPSGKSGKWFLPVYFGVPGQKGI